MTRKVIEDNWMMIGTDNKRKEYISTKKRIKSGEKGIGRFALDRLGSVCELFTKSDKEDYLIRWRTNWNNFEEEGKNLEDIEAEFEYLDENLVRILPKCVIAELEKMEKFFGERPDFLTGTIIKISDLRDEWTLQKIDKMKQSMEFLIPPKEQDEFHIVIQINILNN